MIFFSWLSLLFQTESPVLFPDLTYGFYKVWAQLYGVPYEEVPLRTDFSWHVADYQRECGGIILTNPNAPTGRFQTLDEIEAVLKANSQVVVIIDEAYVNLVDSQHWGFLINIRIYLLLVHFLKMLL